jgi:hypothetical protein
MKSRIGRYQFWIFAMGASLLILSGCSSEPAGQGTPTPDEGAAQDVGVVPDEGTADDPGSGPEDAAIPEDVALTEDTATTEDAPASEDTNIPEDAVVLDEGSAPEDSSVPEDTGVEPPETCGGFVGIPCDQGEYCEWPSGSCLVSDMMGSCVAVPEVCNAIFDPVCGCDGKTYGNDCERQGAQVQKSHDGACDEEPPPDFCGGIAGFPCPDGMICDQEPGFCLGADIGGQCVQVPQVCTDEWDPVCGCDDLTYSNDCQRLMAGASLDHVGECGGGPGKACQAHNECIQGEYCAKASNDCGGIGTCELPPENCITLFAPVCGCDDQTYSNGCVAHSNGANVQHDGDCEGGNPDPPQGLPCVGFIGLPCPDGQTCDLLPGICQGADIPGNCVNTPQVCTDEWDPVCGCNTQTFSNDCQRLMAGVQLDHPGDCEGPAE